MIRYLHENGLKNKKQLIRLKKLLKTNQFKYFEELRTNDKFIKNLREAFNKKNTFLLENVKPPLTQNCLKWILIITLKTVNFLNLDPTQTVKNFTDFFF